ncbi:MAG: HEPN domain-containing protein [Deltaproteobacteria bacterium]|nr:HEPN domain-containing protein [Deltaproteobacteria bacterium]
MEIYRGCLEKLLKATIACEGTFPPKQHNLEVLAELSEIGRGLYDEHKSLLKDMSIMSIGTRYPEEIDEIYSEFPLSKCKQTFILTKELSKYIKFKLQQYQHNLPIHLSQTFS